MHVQALHLKTFDIYSYRAGGHEKVDIKCTSHLIVCSEDSSYEVIDELQHMVCHGLKGLTTVRFRDLIHRWVPEVDKLKCSFCEKRQV